MSFAPYVADCWFLTGATAAGKSAVGIALAQQLGGEIVSLDSMALYRRMDIGTAKPSSAERCAVPHHLIDVIEPAELFSLADYVAAATTAAAEILARERRPIFVGGTPLYLKALLRGIFEGPPADWEFRERMSAEANRQEAGWLHDQVSTVDPVAARRLHPQDTKRLVRVLEVYEKTGQPISKLQQQFEQARPADTCRVFVLDWPRNMLYQRINARVEEMFRRGLVDEVRGLVAEGQELSRTARQALGYREVLEYLAANPEPAKAAAAGAHSPEPLAATIELVQNRTRAFARRQLTWFRSLSECRWIACAEQDSPAALSQRILAARTQ